MKHGNLLMGFHGSKKTRVGKGKEKERVGLEEI